MRTLICGGRDFDNYGFLCEAMARLPFVPSIVIEGGARGADSLAKRWAIEHHIHFAEVPALWDNFGKGAGGRRNSAMLILQPEYCIAFPGGSGTKDMVEKCISLNIPTWGIHRI